MEAFFMLKIKDLHKYYRSKKGEDYHALKGLNIDFPTKGFVFIIGKSGSGKSTLLNVLGGLDRYDSGEIFIKGKSSKSFKAKEWDSYRNTYLGFVFQDFNIIDSYSIGANIALALQLQGIKAAEAKPKTQDILKSVEALELIDRKPNELSGGQKQRIAIARALVKNPEIIIADEPTGNLDSETSKVIMTILQKLSKERLVIMVTHDLEYATEYGDRVIEMRDGEIIKDSTSTGPKTKTTPSFQVFQSERGQEETVIKLPKGSLLTQEVVEAINQVIHKNANQDIYLTASTDVSLARQISSHVSDSERPSEKAAPSELEYDYQGTFNLIKSKLPLRNSLNMALNSIWTKKFKLLFALVLFIASIGLFGFSRTITRFDFPMAASLSYFESGTDQVFIARQETILQPSGDENTFTSQFSRSEVNQLESSTSLSMGRAYDFSRPIRVHSRQSNNLVEGKEIKGLLEIRSLSSMNLTLAAGQFPTSLDEVLITDYIASELTELSHQAFLNTEPTFELPFKTVRIVGIIATDYSQYVFLNSLNSSQLEAEQAAVLSFNNKDMNVYSRMVVGPGFFDLYSSNVDMIRDFYGLTIYLEALEASNDFPYQWLSETFISNDHPIMNTDHVAFFEGYTSIPENGIVLDIDTYQRLLQILKLTPSDRPLEYLFNQEISVSEKMDRLKGDGFGSITMTTAFNERSSNRWYENSEMIVVGIMSYNSYLDEFILPRLVLDLLEENDINVVSERTFNRYAWGAHHEYLDALAQIHLPNFPSLSAYFAGGGNNIFEYYFNLGEALEELEVVFIRDGFIYGYILYLTDQLNERNISFPTYNQFAMNQGADPFMYSLSLVSLTESNNVTILSDSEFIEKYLNFGVSYMSYLYQQLQINNLMLDTVNTNINGLSMISQSLFNEKNPYSPEKVHGLVIQLSDDVNVNYGFFNQAQALGITHLTPSGNLLQVFANFTSNADAIFGYISLGFAGFAALLLFLHISSSILAKKKEIGTLRAMGARGNDVASIFVNEALLLGLISATLAVVGIIVATLQLNGFLSEQLGQTLAIFNISPVIMAEMILLTIVIVLLASFLPVKRVSSMKPIDAIKNK